MNALTHILARSGLLTRDLDYHLIRASMVLIFLAFGYQKWFAYEAQILIPYISNGPLIFWLYPVFGLRGRQLVSRRFRMDVWHLAVFGILEQATGNFGRHRFNAHFHRDRRHHSVRTEGWDPAAGFPAMAGIVPFLMKDVVLLAVSIYLLKQDVVRMIEADPNARVELSEAR